MPLSPGIITTKRLDLVEMTPEFLRASLAGDRAAASAVIGLEVPEGWPEVPSLLKLRLQQIENDPRLQPWLLRAIGLRDSRTMVGHIGFHGAPGGGLSRAVGAGRRGARLHRRAAVSTTRLCPRSLAGVDAVGRQ